MTRVGRPRVVESPVVPWRRSLACRGPPSRSSPPFSVSFGDRRSPKPQPSTSAPGASSTWASGPGEADDGSGCFYAGIPAAGSARRAAFLPGGNEEEEDVPVRQLPFGPVTAEAAGRRCPVHPPALAAAASAVVTSARALPSPPRRGIFVVLWTREQAWVRRGELAAAAAGHPELFLFGRAGCAGGVRFVPRGGGIAPITARAWDLSVTCMLSSCRTVPEAPCS